MFEIVKREEMSGGTIFIDSLIALAIQMPPF